MERVPSPILSIAKPYLCKRQIINYILSSGYLSQYFKVDLVAGFQQDIHIASAGIFCSQRNLTRTARPACPHIYPRHQLDRTQCTSETLHYQASMAPITLAALVVPLFLVVNVRADECHLTPVIHVLQVVIGSKNKDFPSVWFAPENLISQYPGCIPKPIPSFACTGRCTSYVQVKSSLSRCSSRPDLVHMLVYERMSI